MIPKETIEELKKKGNTRILVQLPEGLKTKSTEIVSELEAAGFEAVVSGDLCFGACDLHFLEDATTLHIGHTQMIPNERVVYWKYSYDQDLAPAVEKALPLLGEKIGLFTTAQHLNRISEAKELLEQNNKHVFNSENYQVLGCNSEIAVKIKDDIDTFLYIGTGRFHPIGIAYYTKKTVVAVDPFSLEVEQLDSSVWEKERALRQTKAMNADSYGIVVSSKPGQTNWAEAGKIKQRLEADGKKTITIYLDNVSPDALLPYSVDAFVITACPRIVVDDWKSYKKAILLPDEL